MATALPLLSRTSSGSVQPAPGIVDVRLLAFANRAVRPWRSEACTWSPSVVWIVHRAAASPPGPTVTASDVAFAFFDSDASRAGDPKRLWPRRSDAETPVDDFHATTAVPSGATATCGSVASSPVRDRACTCPQRPDAEQVAAITRPRVDQAAVTAAR